MFDASDLEMARKTDRERKERERKEMDEEEYENYCEKNRKCERSSRFLTFERWSGKCESDSKRGKEIRANENEEEKRRRVDETNKRVTLLRSKKSEEQIMKELKLKRNIYKNSMIMRDDVEEEFDKIDLKHKKRLFRSRRTQAQKKQRKI